MVPTPGRMEAGEGGLGSAARELVGRERVAVEDEDVIEGEFRGSPGNPGRIEGFGVLRLRPQPNRPSRRASDSGPLPRRFQPMRWYAFIRPWVGTP